MRKKLKEARLQAGVSKHNPAYMGVGMAGAGAGFGAHRVQLLALAPVFSAEAHPQHGMPTFPMMHSQPMGGGNGHYGLPQYRGGGRGFGGGRRGGRGGRGRGRGVGAPVCGRCSAVGKPADHSYRACPDQAC